MQDKELRRHCQSIPGTPVIYHAVGGVRLEEPSAKQWKDDDSGGTPNTTLSESDKKVVEKLVDCGQSSSQSKPLRPRRKRAKGPNPLSCLKKKTRAVVTNETTQSLSGEVNSKKKRARPRRRRKKQMVDGDEH